MTWSSLAALFAIGFTYSLYHCVGMCGGFVAAYSASCSSTAGARGVPWGYHLLFNLGRVTSYTVIGAVLGLAGSWAAFFGRFSATRVQGVAAILGGGLMILFGIGLLGAIRMPSGTLVGGSIVRKAFSRLLRSRTPWRTYPLGVLVGTIPCGLVYSMSSYALGSGGPLAGAATMAAFGFGTVPAMFCFGFISGSLTARFRKGMLTVAVILTVVMGIESIRRGIGTL